MQMTHFKVDKLVFQMLQGSSYTCMALWRLIFFNIVRKDMFAVEVVQLSYCQVFLKHVDNFRM